jgi:hypothetical protein
VRLREGTQRYPLAYNRSRTFILISVFHTRWYPTVPKRALGSFADATSKLFKYAFDLIIRLLCMLLHEDFITSDVVPSGASNMVFSSGGCLSQHRDEGMQMVVHERVPSCTFTHQLVILSMPMLNPPDSRTPQFNRIPSRVGNSWMLIKAQGVIGMQKCRVLKLLWLSILFESDEETGNVY